MKNAFANVVFGGSVFDPIKAATAGLGDGVKEKSTDGKKISKPNNLKQHIYDANGEFHVIKSVLKQSKNQNNAVFCDIYMLIDSQKVKGLKQLLTKRPQHIQENNGLRTIKGGKNQQTNINFGDIQ